MRPIIAYDEGFDKEEQFLVRKEVAIEMMKLKTGKTKTHAFQEIKESISSQNDL